MAAFSLIKTVMEETYCAVEFPSTNHYYFMIIAHPSVITKFAFFFHPSTPSSVWRFKSSVNKSSRQLLLTPRLMCDSLCCPQKPAVSFTPASTTHGFFPTAEASSLEELADHHQAASRSLLVIIGNSYNHSNNTEKGFSPL